MRNNRTWFLLGSVLLTALILCFKEWETLAHLNTTLFGDYHDALKNYYTVMYHIRWDESYSWFEGMNYPYGEHVLFTDNQPLLSTILKFIHQNLFPVAGYTIGIINGLMFLSIILTALFSYLCLEKMKVQAWIALLVAVVLSFLSPQLPRINAHYALSYSFIIPLLLYQGLLFIEKPRLRHSLFIAMLVIAVSFIHAYYLGFGLVIFGGLFLAGLFNKNLSFKSKFLHFSLQVILPLVIVQLIMIRSDPVNDRPSYPWSPFINNYKPHGIFFPVGKPIGTWINHNFGLPQIDWEAVTYVGAFASLFFMLSLLALPFMLWSRRGRQLHPLINPEHKMNFLLAAGLASFIIPILFSVLSGKPAYWEMMGPFRQFRAVTRFNWVFYFAINFYAFAWLSKKLRNIRPSRQWLVAAPVLLILINDAYWQSRGPYHTGYRFPLMNEGSTEQREMRERLASYDVMIPIPYFHIGSEDFSHGVPDGEHYKNAMGISYSTGLPITAVMLSRTSLEQTLNQMAYTFLPLDTAAFVKQLQNKQALLLVQKGQSSSPQEEALMAGGTDTVLQQEGYYLQEFDLDKYQRAKARKLESVLSANGRILLERNFEEDTAKAYTGKGSKSIPKEAPRQLGSYELNLSGQNQIKVGMWIYLYQSTKAIERFNLRFADDQGNELGSELPSIRDNLKALHGKWGYAEFKLSPPSEDFTLKISQHPNGLHPTETFVDELKIVEVSQ